GFLSFHPKTATHLELAGYYAERGCVKDLERGWRQRKEKGNNGRTERTFRHNRHSRKSKGDN
ncbi:mCG146073, partial [Mus musculus]